jgi:CTP:molybdopterin cytidylyltransferase MocA
MGRPKALLRDAAGVPFLDRAIGCLLEGGCAAVTVVLGAASAEARALLAEAGWVEDGAVDVVVADDWDTGMGASLRRGLEQVASVSSDRERLDSTIATPDAVAVSLVDLPDVDANVVRRVLSEARAIPARAALARASYDGRPGHPVLIGREHWTGVVEAATGDRGARD